MDKLLRKPAGKAILPDFVPDTKRSDPALYFVSEELAAAVEVALELGQPLLLTGEPGTGKTELAAHIAHYFNLGTPLVFNSQTTSVKKDLFYQYHALEHFQYANAHRAEQPLSAKDFERRFIRYEALGAAILKASDPVAAQRSVVLIDEIDKAPRDLPNDLLAAIDTLKFEVPEIPGNEQKIYQCPQALRPVIIITSNSEKNLPDAFLRRVVYYHIPFPDHKTLLRILESKSETLDKTDREAIVKHFEYIRNEMTLNKKPATAELIFWAFLLPKLGFPAKKLLKLSKLTVAEKNLLETSYSVLAKTREDLDTMRTALKIRKAKT